MPANAYAQIPIELIDLRSAGRSGLSEQIVRQIRSAIVSKRLASGDRLPPSRVLAKELGVARGTVTVAVEMLVAEGLLDTRAGSGTYISDAATLLSESAPEPAESFVPIPDVVLQPDIDLPVQARIDFRPCRPSLEIFPINDWRRCLSLAGSSVPSSDYGDPLGDPRLRQAIADYLRRARGLSVGDENIIVTNGAIHAMALIAQLYFEAGGSAIVEEPGYPLARQVFQQAGASIHTVRVDTQGIVTDDLPNDLKDARLVYITPSHQFPTGRRLALQRRKALIDWAQARGVLIIEDDYDGEFRYDVPPLPPLASMTNQCVVYCGTFSKTMFPGLRIGYAVGAPKLIARLGHLRALSEYSANSVLQHALRGFIDNGHFERHVHRMRKLYARKRQALSDSVAELSGGAELEGIESGLNALLRLPGRHAADAMSEKASHRGILVPSIDRYRWHSRHTNDALVLGFADCTLDQIRTGIQEIFDT